MKKPRHRWPTVQQALERLMTKKSRKRFLERAGPALLVVTFIEDGLRIVLRWSEQMHYMTQVMGMCAPRKIPRARRAKFRARRPSPLTAHRRRPRRLITGAGSSASSCSSSRRSCSSARRRS